MSKDLIEQAKELRNSYARKWRKEHPEKVRETIERYWLKKAKESNKQVVEEDGSSK